MTIKEFKKNIAPYMKKGYVAMNEVGDWDFFIGKPEAWFHNWSDSFGFSSSLDMFDIEPVNNWQESLIEVGK